MFKKLRNSLLVFIMISVSLVMLAAFTAIYIVTYGNIERENERKFQTISSMQFFPDRPIPENGGMDIPPQERFSADYSVSFVLYAADGKLESVYSHLDYDYSVYESAFDKATGSEKGRIALEERNWAYRVLSTPFRYNQDTERTSDGYYERIVFLDVTNSTQMLRELLITLSGVAAAVLLLLLWFSYRFAMRAILPIEESYNKQKQFVADASHELRTPLAVIGANIDAIESADKESVESQKEWFCYIRAELKRTGKLVDDLLYLAKAEEEDFGNCPPFDLSHACETACAAMEAVMYESGIRLETLIQEKIFVFANSEKILQVMYILFDNAGKYTSEGGKVEVVLQSEHEFAVLRVSNMGQEIPDSEIPRIFDRFYRTDSSRSKDTGGFGLGLSIARTIVERSGGTIAAESGGGRTTFTVKLRQS